LQPPENEFLPMQRSGPDNGDGSVVEIHFSLSLEPCQEPAPFLGAQTPLATINSMDLFDESGEKHPIVAKTIRVDAGKDAYIADILRHNYPNTRRIYIVMDVKGELIPFGDMAKFLKQFVHLKEVFFEYGIDASIDLPHTPVDKAKIVGMIKGCLVGLFGAEGYFGVLDVDEDEKWNKGPNFEYMVFEHDDDAGDFTDR
jgi:hypothetical protein